MNALLFVWVKVLQLSRHHSHKLVRVLLKVSPRQRAQMLLLEALKVHDDAVREARKDRVADLALAHAAHDTVIDADGRSRRGHVLASHLQLLSAAEVELDLRRSFFMQTMLNALRPIAES